MPRIPENELERIKGGTDLAALARSRGVELAKHGGKDLIGRCPFHEDRTASFVVTPTRNLFHCLGCGAAGSVIDFVMKHDGLSFRHAVELLRSDKAGAFTSQPRTKHSTVPKLDCPLEVRAEDAELMEQAISYYRERLRQTPAALEYLEQRGIAEAIGAFEIGFADRTLGLRLPHRNRKDGASLRERLIRLGLYRESGHEHFNGCVVFPIRDENNQVSEIYGRRQAKPAPNSLKHLYLPGPHAGILNPESLKSPELILCESVIDALTFWCHGMKNATCIYGTEGFTDELMEAIRKHKTQRVYLAYDRDEAGERAANRDAAKLQSFGIECFRVKFPHQMDANSYSLKVRPPAKSLSLLMKSAEWLGAGSAGVPPAAVGVASAASPGSRRREEAYASTRESQSLVTSAATSQEPAPAPSLSLAASSLAADIDAATKEEIRVDPGPSVVEKNLRASAPPRLKQSGESLSLTLGDREYRVRGLEKNNAFDALKINLRLRCGERFHIDAIDLYQARQREAFIRAAAEETQLEAELIKRDLGKLLLQLEEQQEANLQTTPEDETPSMSMEEQREALELLQSPDLLARILQDFETCGVVGEGVNKLTGYLAATSRKLERPLGVIIQSTSAAGKTMLMESVIAFMPEEERIQYSAMTGQSLYYLGETNLKHKILAIVEEEGAEKASYALKLLQSEGELTIASTGKDDNGRLKTEEYHVEGPVMIFLTTTAIEIDEELLNRCLVLTVDEGRAQTEAIHQIQREAETLEGLQRKLERERLLKLHRNAQRLLRPLHVVNPFAPKLTFLSDRTRTRRDHMKYLTLIRTIALLRQHQKEVKLLPNSEASYVEVTPDDIEAANRLAQEVLGRSLDELSPQTRRLLGLIVEMVNQRCEQSKTDRDQCRFTRREVRQHTGWSEFQVRTHVHKLLDLEYLVCRGGGRAQGFSYQLLFDGSDDAPHLCGLIDVEKLNTTMNASSMKSSGAGIVRDRGITNLSANGHGAFPSLAARS